MSFYRTKTGKYKFRNFLLISMANKKPGINIFMLIPGKVAAICASSACGYWDESGHHVASRGTVSQNIHSETWKCQVIRHENKYQAAYIRPILEGKTTLLTWFQTQTCWFCPCFSYQNSWKNLKKNFNIVSYHLYLAFHSKGHPMNWLE